MTEQRSASGLDFEVLRRAIEERDAKTLASLYAEDAELRKVNRNTTPSFSSLLIGRAAIAGHLQDVCGREMTHRIEREIVGEEHVAFNELCEYPDGTRVLCAAMLDVEDGRTIRQTNVETWDE